VLGEVGTPDKLIPRVARIKTCFTAVVTANNPAGIMGHKIFSTPLRLDPLQGGILRAV